MSHLQVLLPAQQSGTLLNSLHAEAAKHCGISKMMQEIRRKHYFPSNANHVREWVQQCQFCVQDKRFDNSQFTTKVISIPEWYLAPEDVMHIDLLRELPPSGGYENIITAIDVFSR